MKKFTFFITTLFLSVSLFANHVSEKNSKEIAHNYYSHFASKSIGDYSIMNSFTVEYKNLTCYYVFNFKSGGFVIVSADDAVNPILAYSYNGKLKEGKNNPNLDYWLHNYSKEIKYIIDKKYDNSETLKKWNNILNKRFSTKTESKSVDPLLTTTWSQGESYDDYCPEGTPTGCVATAMAQIMNYYEFPATGVSWHAYNHPTYGMQNAFFSKTNYDWANMPDTSGSPAVALLMYHCGVSVDMNYAPDGSGAQSSDVPYALANYFKYSQSINYVEESNYTDSTWKNLLENELDNSRPIYYSAQDTSVGAGHAFVCDGYDANDYFHFNWGWGGSANGYYAIGDLNPGYNFNSDNDAVIGIKPSTPGEEKFLWSKNFSNFPNAYTASAYISAVDTNVAWAIGRDGSGGNADYRVFTKTTTGGAIWVSDSVTDLGGTAFSMIDGLSASTAYIAVYGNDTDNHIIKTTDGGTNWKSILNGAGSTSFFNVVHFFDENNGFVEGDPEGGEFELYTTTNGGDSWTRVSAGNIPDPESGEYGTVGYYDAVGSTIWFSTNKGNIYKSNDKGYTWKKYIINSEGSTATVSFSDNALNGVAIIPISTKNTTVYKKYSTTNGGETWTEMTSITGNFYSSDVSAIPGTSNSFVSVGSDYQNHHMGISYSTDGGQTWIDYADYYKNFQFLSVDMVSETKGFAGSFSGVYSGGIWVLGGINSVSFPDFKADNTITCLNQQVTFTNASIGDADSLLWNFGEDANPPSAEGTGPFTVSFSTTGHKTVSLTLYSEEKEYQKIKKDYISVSTIPHANFTYSTNSTTVSFTNTSSNINDSTTYDWNFGDYSQINHEKNPTHTYNSLSSYHIKLTAYNSEGCYTDTTIKITLTDIPTNAIKDNTIVVYPNPTKDVINITNANNSIIYMYNITGKLLDNFKVGNTELYPLNVSNYAKGSYILKIVDRNKVRSKIVYIVK